MSSDHTYLDAARDPTSGADFAELRSAADDLRALSPDSALARLVEEKIGRLEEAAGEPRSATAP
jgi:hypothetical protein